jgi:hypothetical protein
VDAGETRLCVGRTGAWFDQGDAAANVTTAGSAAAYVAMADSYAGYVGDGVERAGLHLTDADMEIAGTWFH